MTTAHKLKINSFLSLFAISLISLFSLFFLSAVSQAQTAPTKIDLVAASDTGQTNSDNITNSDTLTFKVCVVPGENFSLFSAPSGTDITITGVPAGQQQIGAVTIDGTIQTGTGICAGDTTRGEDEVIVNSDQHLFVGERLIYARSAANGLGLGSSASSGDASHPSSAASESVAVTRDKTAPSLSTVVATDSTNILLTFSEPIYSTNSLASNSSLFVWTPTSPARTLTAPTTSSINFNFASAYAPVGTVISLRFSNTAGGYFDIAGNQAGSKTISVTYPNQPPTVADFTLATNTAQERDQVITVTDANTGDTVTAHWGYVSSAANCNSTNFPSSPTEITLTGDNSALTGTITYSGEANNGSFICVRAGDETAETYKASEAAVAGLTDSSAPTISDLVLATETNVYFKTNTLTFTNEENDESLTAAWFPSGADNCTPATYDTVTANGTANTIELSGTDANNSAGRTGTITYFPPEIGNDRYICVGASDGITTVIQRSPTQTSGLIANATPFIVFAPHATNTTPTQSFDLTINVTDGDTAQVLTAEYRIAGSGDTCDAAFLSSNTTAITNFIHVGGVATNGRTATVTFNAEADNGKKICVKAMDNAGVPSGIAALKESPAVAAIDTTAPGKPTVAFINNTGTSNSDTITNDADLRITSLESGAGLGFSLNSGTTWIDNSIVQSISGTSVDVSGLFTEGSISIIFRQTDPAGNVSASSDVFAFTYDTTAPTATSALTCTDCQNNLANVGDVISYELTLNENVSSTSANSSVTDDLGNVYTLSLTSPSTTLTAAHTVTASSVEGDVTTLTITDVTDTAGNAFSTYTIPTANQVGIDRTVPAEPTLTITDTGSDTSDGITNNPAVAVVGLEANPTWEYQIGTEDWTPGSASGFTLLETTVAQDYKVRQTDQAGNQSTADVTYSFLYDNTAPVISAGFTITSNNTKNTAYAKEGDELTYTFTVTESVGIPASPSPTVGFVFGTTSRSDTIDTFANSSGTYSATGIYTVASGDDDSDGIAMTVNAITDTAGNESNSLEETVTGITVDTVAPLAPTLIDLTNASDTLRAILATDSTDAATLGTDNITQPLTTFSFTGCAEADSDIAFFRGATEYEESDTTKASTDATACTSGTKQFTFVADLASFATATSAGAASSITFKAEDPAGNEGVASTALSVTLDSGVATPGRPALVASTDSGIQGDFITNNTQPQITSTTSEDNSVLQLYYLGADGTTEELIDEQALGTAGTVTFTLTKPGTTSTDTDRTLDDGIYRVFTREIDIVNNTSSDSTTRIVVVDTVAPAVPSKVDLHSADDSSGTNPNVSKDGTDADNITKNQRDISLASKASGNGTSPTLEQSTYDISIYDAANYDHNQIRIYKWIPAVGEDAIAANVDDTELTELSAPADSTTTNILAISGYDAATNGQGRSIETYTGADLAEGEHYFVAKQIDDAGNITAGVSEVLRVLVDITPPVAVRGSVELHPDSDTGEANDDGETSALQPRFFLDVTTPPFNAADDSDTEQDTDYYEVRFTQLTDALATTGSEFYPSSTTIAQQGSLLIDNSATPDFHNRLAIDTDLTNIPSLNTWYQVYIYAVDTAGNSQSSIDLTRIKILVPPVTPTAPDLSDASDTFGAPSTGTTTGTNADDITNSRSWSFSSTWTNGTAEEIANDSAATVTGQTITVYPPGYDFQQGAVNTFAALEIEQDSNAQPVTGTITSTGTGTSKVYSFSSFDFTIPDTYPDGEYIVRSSTFNSGKERSSTVDTTITLDTEKPTLGTDTTNDVVIKTTSSFSGAAGSRKQIQEFTAGSIKEQDAIVVVYSLADGSETASTNEDEVLSIDTLNSDGSTYESLSDYQLDSDLSGGNAYSADFTYFVKIVDKAGNESDVLPLLDSSKSPNLDLYIINGVAGTAASTNTHIAVSSPRSGTVSSFEYQSRTAANCGNSLVGIPTSYTEGSVITEGSDGQCFRVIDDSQNAAYIHTSDTSELVSNFRVLEADDTGSSNSDNIVNTGDFSIQARTLPGLTYSLREGTDDVASEVENGTSDAVTGDILVDLSSLGLTDTSADVTANGTTINTFLHVTYNGTEYGPFTLDVTIDQIPHEVPSGAYLGLAANTTTTTFYINDPTSGNTDFKISDTNGTTPFVTTNVQTGDKANLYLDGVLIATSDLTANGTFEFSPTDLTTESDGTTAITYPDGRYTFAIEFVDNAGNAGSQLDLPLITDTTAPVITIVRVAGTDNADATSDRKYIAVVADANPQLATELAAYQVDSGACQSTFPGTATQQSFTTQYPTGTSTGQYCYYAFDLAGNSGTETTSNAIEGVGNLQVQDATKVGSTYHISSGTKELTGITAAGAKVFIELADAANAPADGTSTATNEVTLDSTVSDISTQVTFSPANDGQNIYAWIQTNPLDTATLTPPISLGTITIDDVSPTIGSIGGYSSQQRIFKAAAGTPTFSISTFSEEIAEIDLELGGIEVSCSYEISFTTCGVIRTIAQTDSNGIMRLIGTVKDRAGNTAAVNELTPYIVDTTPPAVSVTSSKGTLIDQSTATLSITVSDDYGLDAGSHTFTVTGGTGTCTLDTVETAEGQYAEAPSTCDITVTSTTDGDEITLTPSAAISDRAHRDGQSGTGNFASTTPIVVHRVDISAPTVDSIEEFDVSNRRRPETSIYVTHGQVAANNVLPESLTAAFEGDCSSFDDISITSATPTPTVSTRYDIEVSSPSVGRYSDCSLKLTDGAGNESNSIDIEEFTIRKSSGGGGGILSRFFDEPFDEPEADTTPEVAQIQTPIQTQVQPIATYVGLVSVSTPYGGSGEDVRDLQIALNKTECRVSTTGAGSPGFETAYFGEKTRQAVRCLQGRHNLQPTGVVDVNIENILNRVIEREQITPEQQAQVEELRRLISALIDRIRVLIAEKQASQSDL